MLLGARLPDSEAVLPAFVNVANDTSDPIIFVLDDYHLIEEPSIHAALTYLLDHLPPTLHFVLVGRGEPPLSLARYRAIMKSSGCKLNWKVRSPVYSWWRLPSNSASQGRISWTSVANIASSPITWLKTS
jgi:hypothetical protein